jgi:putative membrane protein
MNTLITLLLSSVAVFVTGQILPGVHLNSFFTAVVVAVVLGFINTFIRPLIFLLTLPINILTLGLFTLVIMAGMVMLTAWIVPGFDVDSFWWALGFSIVLAILNSFIESFSNS